MTHYRMISRQRATERVHGAPLVRIAAKSPSHVRAWQTRKAKRHLDSFGEFRRGRV